MKEIYAHGAITPVKFDGTWLRFGASCGEEKYPVVFMGGKNIRELYDWLGEILKSLEERGENEN